MAAVYNDAGKMTLANSTVVTTGTPTGGGGNQTMTITGSSTRKRIDNSLPQPLSDSAWYEISAQTGTAAYLSIQPTGYVAATGGAVGCWMYFMGSAPSATFQLIRWGNNGSNFLSITTAFKLALVINSATVYTMSGSLALNGLYWICHRSNSSSTAGSGGFGVWDSKGVLIESYDSATNLNSSGIVGSTSSIGKISATGNTGIIKVASIRANTNANVLIPPPIPRGTRGWNLAA